MFGSDDSPACVVTLVISSVNWNNQYPITRETSYILVDGNFSHLMYCRWSAGQQEGGGGGWASQEVLSCDRDPGWWTVQHQLSTPRRHQLHYYWQPAHCGNLKGTWDLIIICWNVEHTHSTETKTEAKQNQKSGQLWVEEAKNIQWHRAGRAAGGRDGLWQWCQT